MSRADALPLHGATLKAQTDFKSAYLEDTALRRTVLDLYDAEHVALRRYLLFLGVNADVAGEALQEAFLKLHEHLLNDGDRSNLRAWLYRVTHNLARNWQTSHGVSRTEPLPETDASREYASPHRSAEETLLEEERSVRFQRALAGLSVAQRGCLVLRTRGLKYREIAQIMNLSVSTVGENIERGIARMRELL